MINPYGYPSYISKKLTCHVEPVKSARGWTRYQVEIPSLYQTRYVGDSPIKGEYYRPNSNGLAPLVVLIHGMGDHSVIPCRLIARDLSRVGVASFIIYLVFHSKRAIEVIQSRYPNLSGEEWDECYKLSVNDVRQVLDWAGTRPEINPEQIAALGISYGSFITAIAMAVDKRVNRGVLVECGGNSDKITRDSLILRWRYKMTPQQYQDNQKAYLQYLEAVSVLGWEKVENFKASYLTDPLTFAQDLRGRPLMLLNASFDEMIPKSATRELWENLARPPIYWYPATHASLWAWYPFFRKKITDFIGRE
jgi:dienelactone hydrolase